MIKGIVIAVMLAAASCTSKPDLVTPPDTPIIVPQDLEGCVNDPQTPWCQAACKNPKHEWCETHEVR